MGGRRSVRGSRAVGEIRVPQRRGQFPGEVRIGGRHGQPAPRPEGIGEEAGLGEAPAGRDEPLRHGGRAASRAAERRTGRAHVAGRGVHGVQDPVPAQEMDEAVVDRGPGDVRHPGPAVTSRRGLRVRQGAGLDAPQERPREGLARVRDAVVGRPVDDAVDDGRRRERPPAQDHAQPRGRSPFPAVDGAVASGPCHVRLVHPSPRRPVASARHPDELRSLGRAFGPSYSPSDRNRRFGPGPGSPRPAPRPRRSLAPASASFVRVMRVTRRRGPAGAVPPLCAVVGRPRAPDPAAVPGGPVSGRASPTVNGLRTQRDPGASGLRTELSPGRAETGDRAGSGPSGIRRPSGIRTAHAERRGRGGA